MDLTYGGVWRLDQVNMVQSRTSYVNLSKNEPTFLLYDISLETKIF